MDRFAGWNCAGRVLLPPHERGTYADGQRLFEAGPKARRAQDEPASSSVCRGLEQVVRGIPSSAYHHAILHHWLQQEDPFGTRRRLLRATWKRLRPNECGRRRYRHGCGLLSGTDQPYDQRDSMDDHGRGSGGMASGSREHLQGRPGPASLPDPHDARTYPRDHWAIFGAAFHAQVVWRTAETQIKVCATDYQHMATRASEVAGGDL